MRNLLLNLIWTLFLAGCTNFPAILPTPDGAENVNETATPSATPTRTPLPPQPEPSDAPVLRVWLPPQFDPSADTTAGKLLQERLDEFMARRPGLQIRVRIKSDNGSVKMLDALTVTDSAAPAVMPDLVALSRSDLEAAALNGLLHPLDGLTTSLDDPDWYPYAHQMARIQNTTYGLPFAGDALALIGYENPLPTGWNEIPEETSLIFPAADPQALFSFSLYLSTGESLRDNQGNLSLEDEILIKVLSLYQPTTSDGFITPSSADYQDDEQAWNAFLEQRGNISVSWVSNYLKSQSTALVLSPLPALETGQYTLATGWNWGLAGSNSENQPLAVELAEFLSESQFLSEWNQATGFLPTRPTALSSWDDPQEKRILSQTAESAALVPSQESLNAVGPSLAEATNSVISGTLLPSEAVQSISE